VKLKDQNDIFKMTKMIAKFYFKNKLILNKTLKSGTLFKEWFFFILITLTITRPLSQIYIIKKIQTGCSP
jgi:hypothetical protein